MTSQFLKNETRSRAGIKGAYTRFIKETLEAEEIYRGHIISKASKRPNNHTDGHLYDINVLFNMYRKTHIDILTPLLIKNPENINDWEYYEGYKRKKLYGNSYLCYNGRNYFSA